MKQTTTTKTQHKAAIWRCGGNAFEAKPEPIGAFLPFREESHWLSYEPTHAYVTIATKEGQRRIVTDATFCGGTREHAEKKAAQAAKRQTESDERYVRDYPNSAGDWLPRTWTSLVLVVTPTAKKTTTTTHYEEDDK